MTPEQWDTAPPQHIFDEIKEVALGIWVGVGSNRDSDVEYRNDKIGRVRAMKNAGSSAWAICQMFHCEYREKLIHMLSPEAAEMVRDAFDIKFD